MMATSRVALAATKFGAEGLRRFAPPRIADDRKLLAGITVSLVAILAMLAVSVLSLSTVIRSQSILNETYTRNLLLARDLRDRKHEQIGLVPMYVLTGDETLRLNLARADTSFAAALDTLRSRVTTPRAKATLDQIARLQHDLLGVEGAGLAMRKAGRSIADVNAFFRAKAGPASFAVMSKINQFADQASVRYNAEKAINSRRFERAFFALSAAALLCLAIFASVAVLLLREQDRRRAFEEVNSRLLEREQEISRARKEAVEIVSHDLRSPLTAIIFASEMLNETSSTRSEREATLVKTMFSSAHSMYQMINNLLDHAKIEAGELELDRHRVDVSILIDRVDARFQLVAARKRVELVNVIPAGVLMADIDDVRMEQVLSNLVGNALKFTQAGGEVRISGEVHQDDFELHVADTGMGMTQEQAVRTFDRYWQAKETASLGSGLGLAICKAIVDAHGGSISVRSAPGEGSVFSVRMPLAAP